MATTIHTIDAKDQSLGRLASKVAAILNGKTTTDFTKNRVSDVTVKVVNASKVKLTGKKMEQSIHKTYSGYPGGLKEKNFTNVVEKKGYSELIKHAVYGMLPKNRLQDLRMKNLVIED